MSKHNQSSLQLVAIFILFLYFLQPALAHKKNKTSDGSTKKSSSGGGGGSSGGSGDVSVGVSFKGSFSQVIAFGDSYTDTGNCMFMNGLRRFFGGLIANSPYGSIFKSPKNGNRFCDGRLVVDFLCESLGLPHLPPYKDPKGNVSGGVNFAVSGSTSLTSDLFSKYKIGQGLLWKSMVSQTFKTQLDWFEEFVEKMAAASGGGSSGGGGGGAGFGGGSAAGGGASESGGASGGGFIGGGSSGGGQIGGSSSGGGSASGSGQIGGSGQGDSSATGSGRGQGGGSATGGGQIGGSGGGQAGGSTSGNGQIGGSGRGQGGGSATGGGQIGGSGGGQAGGSTSGNGQIGGSGRGQGGGSATGGGQIGGSGGGQAGGSTSGSGQIGGSGRGQGGGIATGGGQIGGSGGGQAGDSTSGNGQIGGNGGGIASGNGQMGASGKAGGTGSGQASASAGIDFTKVLVYIGEMGVNDYARMISSTTQNGNWLSQISVDQVTKILQTVLIKGAKYIVVQGIPPVGCLPLALSHVPDSDRDEHGCSASINSIVKFHNQLLQKRIAQIQGEHKDCVISYADYYSAYITIMTNVTVYQVQEPLKACCGASSAGPLNFSPKQLCGAGSTGKCSDPSKYIVWDGLHLTEAMHKHLADLFFNKGYCHPSISEMIVQKNKCA